MDHECTLILDEDYLARSMATRQAVAADAHGHGWNTYATRILGNDGPSAIPKPHVGRPVSAVDAMKKPGWFQTADSKK